MELFQSIIFFIKICGNASDELQDVIDEKKILDNKYWNQSTNDFSKITVKLDIDKGTVDKVSYIVVKLNEVKEK